MKTSLYQFKRLLQRANYDPARHRLRMTIHLPARAGAKSQVARLVDINNVTVARVEAEYNLEDGYVAGVGIWPAEEGAAIDGVGVKNRYGEKFTPPPFTSPRSARGSKTPAERERELKFGHLRSRANMNREQAARANAGRAAFMAGLNRNQKIQ